MDFLTRWFKGKEKSAYGDGAVLVADNSRGINRANLISNDKNWVAIAVNKISLANAGVRYKVMRYERNGDDKEIFDGKVIELMEKPHPHLTWRKFVFLNTGFKELTGNAFWQIRDAEGGGKMLCPLVPTRVRPIYDSQTLVGYKYMNGAREQIFGVDEVLHDFYPSFSNPYWGEGPLEKIADWIDIDNYAAEFTRKFFINGAQFGGWLETDEESRERIELIKVGLKRDHTGVKNAHKIGVLPKNTKFKEATMTMTDMQFSEQDGGLRDKILSAFGVPKTLVGLTTEVNRASAEASEYVFAQYTLKPKVDMFIDFLNNFLIPIFDKTGKIYFDYDNFIPEDKDLKIREYQAALANQQYMTVNEVRASKGLPPVSGGDAIYGNPFQTPLGEVEDAEDDDEDGDKTAIDIMAERAASVATKAMKEISREEKDAAKHKDFVSRVEAYQKQMVGKIRDFNEHQKNEIIRSLGQITKAVSRGDLFDMNNEVGVMIDLVSPLLKGLMVEQAIQEYLAQEFQGQFNPNASTIDGAIAKAAKRMAKSYNKVTAQLLARALNEGLKKGESLADLAKRVQDVYEFSDKYRAGMVAHTETFYIANEGSKEAYKQSGVVKSIRWYTADGDACEFCEPLNGEVVGVEESFFAKGETYTGSRGGTLHLDYREMDVPPLHPNCRCFIQPEEISIEDLSAEENEEQIIKEIEALANEERD